MSFDDIFTTPQEPQKDNFDKDAWAERKKAERTQVYALVDLTAEKMGVNGDALRTYLDVQARFDRYSVTNAILISAQNPNATRLGSFDYWKNQGAFVKKNQQGITILEPGDEYLKDDGSIGVSYNPKRVFDQLQTNQQRVIPPTAKHDERTLIRALIHNSPVPVKSVDELPSGVSGAVFDPKKNTIYVQKGMSGQEIFRSLALELAHAELAGGDVDYTRTANGFNAYCVSYVLCERNNVDTQGYNFDRMPESLSKMEAQEIRAELSQIREVSGDISARMNEVLDKTKQPRQQDAR